MANHNKISNFENITWNRLQQKWRARIRYKGTIYIDACYETEDEAVKALDKTIITYNIPKKLQSGKYTRIAKE